MTRTKTLEATAFHEAGHAVIAWKLGRRFRHASIARDDETATLGHVLYHPWPKSARPDIEWTPRVRMLCENAIMTALAGPRAEKLRTGRWHRVGASSDHASAGDFALEVCGSSESANAYLRWLSIRVRDLLKVSHTWRVVERVAAALLERQRLTHAEFIAVVDPDLALFDGMKARLAAQVAKPKAKRPR